MKIIIKNKLPLAPPDDLKRKNPLNVSQLKNTPWKGSVPATDRFAHFSTDKWGWRAAYKNLLAKKGRLMTVSALIREWAPPHENSTDTYIKNVLARMGSTTDLKMNYDSPQFLVGLAVSMAISEHGRLPDTNEAIEAWNEHFSPKIEERIVYEYV